MSELVPVEATDIHVVCSELHKDKLGHRQALI